MVTIIKKVGAISAGKAIAVVAAIIGFLYGLAFSLISIVFQGLLGSIASLPSNASSIPGFSGMGFGSLFGAIGILAIIALPILFAIIGFIAGIIGAAIYNFIASRIGGIEIELSETGDAEKHPGLQGSK